MPDKKSSNILKIYIVSCCYNEEDILPFYLDYYINFIKVDKIIIFDGGSTDNTSNIVKEYPNVEFIVDDKGNMDERNLTFIRNNGWKEYKNDYDWVIVCDMDEFIYHTNLREILDTYKKEGITIANIDGYDMISENFPIFEEGKYLPSIIRYGIYEPIWLNKKAIFDPKQVNINYDYGTHGCNPIGNIKYSNKFDIKLLHYKWLSYEYVINKSKKASQRLSNWNMETGMASHYKIYGDMKYDDFHKKLKSSELVINNFPIIKKFIFSHNYLINDWKNIFENQLSLIKNSGLYNEIINIFIYVYYNNSDNLIQFKEIIKKYDINNKVITNIIDINFYEYPTLQELYKFSIKQEYNTYILYIHLKGIWSSNDSTKNKEAIKSWRKCLEYFNIEKWKNCVDKLNEGYDVVGALYNYNEIHPLFSGNFWWASSEYIKKLKYPEYDPLKNPYIGTPEDDGTWCRVECEKWINTIPNKFYNFYIPKDYGFYYVPIKEEDYKDKKIEDINKKIYDLLQKTRMFFNKNTDGDVNVLYGLKLLIEENLNKDSIICEIGSYAGRYAELFSLYCKEVYCIDKWEEYDEEEANIHMNEAEQLFDEMILRSGNVKKIKKSSLDAVNDFPDKYFDCVYIDASHKYEDIKNDIINWIPKVKLDGIISGHDYYSWGNDVQRVVDDIFHKENVKKIYQDSSWVVKMNDIFRFDENISNKGYWIGEKPLYESSTDQSLKKYLSTFFKENNYSVYDLGCEFGEYINEFIKNNIKCKGFDGNPITNDINKNCHILDLSEKFILDEKYDYILSLEVGEHIPEEYEDNFIENLHNHNNKGIIISWAPPYNGGYGHFNCKSNEYIKEKFNKLGYKNNIEFEKKLRDISDFPWFKESIMVFEKIENFILNNTIEYNNIKEFIDKLWIESNELKIQQKEVEWKELLDVLIEYDIEKKYALEIGGYNLGGTHSFCELFDKVITIDSFKQDNWDDFKNNHKNWAYFLGDSHSDEIYTKIKNLDIKFNMIFIDGDHTYDGCKNDFIRYKQLLKEDGIICFHDIKETDFHKMSSCNVSILWKELKIRYKYKEIIYDSDFIKNKNFHSHLSNNDWGGIGILFNIGSTKNKISVIIPTYNRNDLLKEAIDSILNQNYDNIEILVCHDGPSDEYNKFKKIITDNRIKFYNTDVSNNNLGATQRNEMLKIATGDYILFLDDDNILYDDYLETMTNNIENNTGMIVCKIHFNDKEWNNYILPLNNELKPCFIDHLSILFKSDIAKQFTWDDQWGQDHRYINNCENLINEKSLKIKYIDNVLAKHRYNENIQYDKPIIIFNHNYLINNWRDIIIEQINLLRYNDLYKNCKEIYSTVYSNNIEYYNDFEQIIKKYDKDNKWNIINMGKNEYEFECLNLIKNYCISNDVYICYYHTKGVYSESIPENIGVKSWRDYLNYYIIENWKLCIEKLKDNDIVGVDYNYNDMHNDYVIGGNFFWSKSEHIKNLPDIEYNNNRFISETWILKNNCKVFEHNNYLYHNIKNPYMEYFDPLLYKITNKNKIKEKNKKIYDLDNIINISFEKYQAQQNKWELKELLKKLIDKNKTGNILEIGSKFGGTTFSFCNIFDKVISVDFNKEDQITELEHNFDNLTFILGDSHDINTKDKIKNIKFDVIYIDGDHSYDSVKKDFLMYKDLIKNDGIIILHDIKQTWWTDSIGIQVPIFWNEIKTDHDYEEIINIGENDCYGLGLLYTKNNNEIVIISSYPNHKSSENITKECILSFKKTGRKIILTSHCEISKELQDLCDFYIYDKNNILIEHDFFSYTWMDSKDYRVEINLKKYENNLNHSLTVYNNYYNGISLAKSMGYNTVICTNFDNIISKNDHIIIDNKINDMKINNKKAYFMSKDELYGMSLKTIFFITDVDFFVNNFKYFKTKEEYLDDVYNINSQTNCLENYFLSKFKNKIDEILIEKNEETLLFPNSKINQFSNIEYMTVLQVNKDNNILLDKMCIWYSSSNKLDNRELKINIFEKDIVIFSKKITIDNNFKYYEILDRYNDCKIEFLIMNEYNEIIKNKVINLPIDYNLNDNGTFTLLNENDILIDIYLNDRINIKTNKKIDNTEISIFNLNNTLIYQNYNMSFEPSLEYWIRPDNTSFLNGFKIEFIENNKKILEKTIKI